MKKFDGQPNWESLSGLLVAAIGVSFLVAGWSLRPGTLAEMGPGYMPRVLSIAMIVLGIYISGISWRKDGQPLAWPRLRPLLVVAAAPVLFGLLVEPLGLVPTILIVTTVARFAEPQKFSWDAIFMPLVMVVFCVIVFVELIGLPINLWP